jgi:hypothetical protein
MKGSPSQAASMRLENYVQFGFDKAQATFAGGIFDRVLIRVDAIAESQPTSRRYFIRHGSREI